MGNPYDCGANPHRTRLVRQRRELKRLNVIMRAQNQWFSNEVDRTHAATTHWRKEAERLRAELEQHRHSWRCWLLFK